MKLRFHDFETNDVLVTIDAAIVPQLESLALVPTNVGFVSGDVHALYFDYTNLTDTQVDVYLKNTMKSEEKHD